MGLLTALVLLDKGVLQVDLAETNPLRRRTVQTHTDCHVFDPIKTTPGENTYDLVFDAVGGAVTRPTSVKCAKPGAVIVHIGLMDNQGTLDVRRMTLQEITFIGCYTYTPVDLRVTLQKLHSGGPSVPWTGLNSGPLKRVPGRSMKFMVEIARLRKWCFRSKTRKWNDPDRPSVIPVPCKGQPLVFLGSGIFVGKGFPAIQCGSRHGW